jgi:uncharacterized membrane protein
VPSAEQPSASRRYERGGDEFGRVLAFSDGLFAIAMTLLVVGIAVPKIADAESVGDLADALADQGESLISFLISFLVIGRYWIAHHQMFSLLRAMDRGLIGLNLFYLLLIAFLPFPTALMGTYFDNPLAIGIYAVTAAAVSAMEVVLLAHAHRHDLLAKRMPEDLFRWGATTSLTPVAAFLLSVPVAFVGSGLAVLCWVTVIPISILANRWAPPEAEEYFG